MPPKADYCAALSTSSTSSRKHSRHIPRVLCEPFLYASGHSCAPSSGPLFRALFSDVLGEHGIFVADGNIWKEERKTAR